MSATNVSLSALILMIAVLCFARPASAQMFEKPYAPPEQNRASLAVIMKQAESGLYSNKTTGTTTSSGGSSLTQLVCGAGTSQSSATANSSCIILNNSNGAVTTGQDSTGNQTADANTTTTHNNTDLSSALETMSGTQ